MKHIGACLDNIQITLGQIPRNIDSSEDKARAVKIVDEIQEYAHTLEQLIMHPNLRTYLHNLEKTPIDGIRLQAHEVEELLKDLEHMLYVLEMYVKNLREIIENNPDQWSKKADQLVLMIYQKFGGEKGELRREFKIALYKADELRQIVTSEKHLAEFLK